ncbi:MAG: glycosyltransferase [Leptolyngbyaceae cyanobacterium bins.302]|nr:glycosyltransferase [Leptolyngbyaceae cyanobacterium bins.302]
MLKLLSIVPFHLKDNAIGHVFCSLHKKWQQSDIQAQMIVPSCEPYLRQPAITEAVSPLLRWYYYKQNGLPKRKAEKLFLKKLKHFDAAYIWPGISLETTRQAKAISKPIFLERVNCFTGHSKQILDDAYARIGLKPTHPNTLETVEVEREEIDLADFIICPSQTVTQSYLDAGVPGQKLLTASEGWCPERFPYLSQFRSVEKQSQSDEFKVVFMGSDSIRKGLHLFLRVWEKANIPGKLIILGHLDPRVAEICGDTLSRLDVVHLGARPDYASFYLDADLFVLPSLEEGSPLVTYEAMAHGLPIVASPMGAGGIVRDGLDGIVLPPYEEDCWVDALIKLASDPSLRHQLGESARRQAYQYTWEKVAARRANLMLSALNQPSALSVESDHDRLLVSAVS